jgi:hypothetical protein
MKWLAFSASGVVYLGFKPRVERHVLPVTVMSVGQEYKKKTKGVKLIQSRYHNNSALIHSSYKFRC